MNFSDVIVTLIITIIGSILNFYIPLFHTKWIKKKEELNISNNSTYDLYQCKSSITFYFYISFFTALALCIAGMIILLTDNQFKFFAGTNTHTITVLFTLSFMFFINSFTAFHQSLAHWRSAE